LNWLDPARVVVVVTDLSYGLINKIFGAGLMVLVADGKAMLLTSSVIISKQTYPG
jgi:hypothetical protein